MDKKELVKILLKVVIYALGLFAAYFGVSSFTSCSITRQSDIKGTARVVTVDTTYINHGSTLKYPK